MPDSKGNLTRAEVEVLKSQIVVLEGLEENFKNLEKIGYDTKEDKMEQQSELKRLRNMVRVYEPLIIED